MNGTLKLVLDRIKQRIKRRTHRVTNQHLSRAALATMFIALVTLFYSSNFREQLENLLHDSRIKLMPSTDSSELLRIVSIDDTSINRLEPDVSRLRTDADNKPYLSTRHAINAVRIMANTSAKAIILLLPEHAFPSTDPDMLELINIVKFDARFMIGTTGYNQLTPNLEQLPEIFED
jgi:hypothetical protein